MKNQGKEIGIVVGFGFDPERGGQKEISSALRSRGHFVKEVGFNWPRNDYVFLNDGKYIFDGMDIFYEERNAFGNGGMVQKAEKFMLVSDSVKEYLQFKNGTKNVEELIKEQGEKEYGKRVHVVPTNGANGDIDMYTLLLPESKILLFDNDFSGKANINNDYNKVAEQEEFKFIEINGKESGAWYPLNSLLLKKGFKDVVALDKNAKSLIKILEEEGIDFIPIDIPQREYPAGKINCQTNTFYKKDLKMIDSYFTNTFSLDSL